MGKKHTAEFTQVRPIFLVVFSTMMHCIEQDLKNPEKPSAQTDLEREIADLCKKTGFLGGSGTS